MNGSKEMNNEFLGNCSTVPSEPLFIGGNDKNFMMRGINPTTQSGINTKANINNMVAAIGP
jgi:hypothetical protein